MLKNLLILYNPFIEIEAICKLCLLIDSKIYGMFAKLYTFYVDLAGRRIFNKDVLEALTNRIYIFVGIIALFFVAYTLLKAIVDPDKGLKDGGGKLVFNIVSSLIMILLSPIIFEMGYKVTDIIVNENIIGKVFLGGDSISSGESVIPIDYTQQEEDESGAVVQEADLGSESIKNDVARETLRVYGNQTAFLVLNAFLYPLEENVTVNASDEYNLQNGIELTLKGSLTGAGVAVGGIALIGVILAPFTAGASLAAIPSAIASSASAIATAALVGGATGILVNGAGYVIDYEKYTWDNAQMEMVYGGNFDIVTAFSEGVDKGTMQYSPIISTICGVILLYFMLGFCLDLGIRTAKLAMFEMLAPIPILLRIVPGQEKVFKSWFTNVLSTFFEIVIRIGILFGVSYLISLIPTMTLFSDNSMGSFAKCLIVLGLIAFIKEAPKLLSDVIGIKGAGNIKFGLKDKLATTGALTAAAAIGGGAVGMLRNGVNAGKNVRDAVKKHKTGDKWTKADLKNVAKDYKTISKATGSGILSTIAGGTSGAFNAIKGGGGKAKTYADVGKAVESGGNKALKNAQYRAKYKEEHGGNVFGTIKGHVADFQGNVTDWFNYSGYDRFADELKFYKYITDKKSEADNSAQKIFDKYKNNKNIIPILADMAAKMDLYKNNLDLVALHDELIVDGGYNLDILEKQLATLKNRTSFKLGETVKYYNATLGKWVDGYVDQSGRVFEEMFVHPDTGEYYFDKKISDSASLLHNQHASQYESFVNLLTKETKLGIQDAAVTGSGVVYDVIKGDISTLKSTMLEAADLYVEGASKDAVKMAQDTIATKSVSGAGHILKVFDDEITGRKAAISRERDKEERLRAARKKDDK